jgi:hypothetical protein
MTDAVQQIRSLMRRESRDPAQEVGARAKYYKDDPVALGRGSQASVNLPSMSGPSC